MIDVARAHDRHGFKSAVRMLGKAGHDVAVVHPPAVLALEVLADLPSTERGGRTEPVVAGGIVIDVMDAEEERVVRLPPLTERIDADDRSHRMTVVGRCERCKGCEWCKRCEGCEKCDGCVVRRAKGEGRR